MSLFLPHRPRLEHLKSQAKDLLAAYRAHSADAEQRIHAFFSPATAVDISHAQLVLAREHGFESWAKLKAQVTLLENDSARAEHAEHSRRWPCGGTLQPSCRF